MPWLCLLLLLFEGNHGFLKELGAIDIGGSGAVHLIGGSSCK